MCLNDTAELEFDRFRRLGLNVLIPEYVGYGMSGGKPSEAGCRDTADAAYEHLRKRKDVDPDEDHRGRLVARRRGRHRPGVAQAGRRPDRLQHVHQHDRHGPATSAVPARPRSCCGTASTT